MSTQPCPYPLNVAYGIIIPVRNETAMLPVTVPAILAATNGDDARIGWVCHGCAGQSAAKIRHPAEAGVGIFDWPEVTSDEKSFSLRDQKPSGGRDQLSTPVTAGQDVSETSAHSQVILSILMTSYNTAAMTETALASIEATTQTAHEVILIDNGSTDDTLARISQHFPKVRVIAMGHNTGYAVANNTGAARARGQFLLIANSDICALEGGIDRLVDMAGRLPTAGIWGMRTLSASMQINPTFCWRRISVFSIFCRTFALSAVFRRWNFANPESCPEGVSSEPVGVDVVTGCFLLISRGLWDRLGGFDPAFAFFGEDADLCLRAIGYGAQPTIVPLSGVIHLGGGTAMGSVERRICMLAARIGLIRRHMRGPAQSLAIWLTRLDPALRLQFHKLCRALGHGTASLVVQRQVWNQRAKWWSGY